MNLLRRRLLVDESLAEVGGSLIFGPTKSHAARSIAVVNGSGSVGQMLAPLLVNWFAQTFGWENLFNLFLITSLIAAAIVAVHWNDENGNAQEEAVLEA